MNTLTEQDLKMLRDAVDAMREPQAVLAFVQRHIAQTYGITQADSINPKTGEIARSSAPVLGSQAAIDQANAAGDIAGG